MSGLGNDTRSLLHRKHLHGRSMAAMCHAAPHRSCKNNTMEVPGQPSAYPDFPC